MAMDTGAATILFAEVGAAVAGVGTAWLLLMLVARTFGYLRQVLADANGPGTSAVPVSLSMPSGRWHTIKVNGVERSVWVESDPDDGFDAKASLAKEVREGSVIG